MKGKNSYDDGQSFVARYEKLSRKSLPSNITIKKLQRIGPRWQRTRQTKKSGNIVGNIVRLGAKVGSKLGSSGFFRRAITTGTTALSSQLGKKLIFKRIKHDPDLYRLEKSIIKNKNMRKALQSDVGNYLVEETNKQKKQKKY